MPVFIGDSVKQLQYERDISEELVLKTIEETLLAAYKRRFRTSENAVVKFSKDLQYVTVYARKEVVEDDDWDNPYLQIELSEAQEHNQEAEVGDEILIEVNTHEFDRTDIQAGKQRARQDFKEIQKNTLYSEYKDKVGEIVVGYHQRLYRGSIYVDIGRTEAIIPKRFQSPREHYEPGDRIRAMILEVKKGNTGLSIVLTRTHAEFVKRMLELEIPELSDETVYIHKIVREPGYRTKLAVYSHRNDIDPVGACVGARGQRIQNVVRELEGEKIDVLLYEDNISEFIKNALAPAKVNAVYIMNQGMRKALAVVAEDQLSLAIGKNGLNIRLANKLVDWNIEVKTEAQVSAMDLNINDVIMPDGLFSDEYEEHLRIEHLPGISERLISLLSSNGIEFVDSLRSLDQAGMEALASITADDITRIKEILHLHEELEAHSHQVEQEQEEEFYECPECGGSITIEMQECPHCGVGLSFEMEENEE
ncbi:transcription termination factor NusA [Entomospira entomophila]|uniref:Transcription termination/antitermination protein NusA n=1 Tax=Entomospira entomophila TaxID=2719988 RepID=A0A968GD66_9SPIO|nr:transcription termination factor NusA [Entomospira entomophilus]NIZ40824.1 transcription termination/antitermination protein NusA [Entomospira entomophilus]WDI35036.1 transcription termination factor NusA [Entomospira entomophilus]